MQKPQRTVLLWCLAILTMIGAFSNFFSYLCFFLFPDLMHNVMEMVKATPMFDNEQSMQLFEAYMQVASWKFGLLSLTEAAIFAGALMMLWKLNSLGFHIYTIGQICALLIVNFLLGKPFDSGLSGVLMTAIFVLMFYTQLKYMKPAQDEERDEEDVSNTENIDM